MIVKILRDSQGPMPSAVPSMSLPSVIASPVPTGKSSFSRLALSMESRFQLVCTAATM